MLTASLPTLSGRGLDYREYRPDPRLATHIEYFWTMNAPRPLASPVLQSSPSKSSLDLIVTLDGSFCHQAERHLFGDGSKGAYLVGAMSAPRDIVTRDRCRAIGARFRPGRAGALLGLSMQDLTDRVVALGSVSTLLERRVSALAHEGRGGAHSIRLVEQAMLDLCTHERSSGDQKTIAAALNLIEERSGDVSVADLASHVGRGVRQLERQFREFVGIRPKLACRIVRVRRAMQLLPLEPGTRWTDVVHSCGFYDQAHFIREFRAIAGVTPGRFIREFEAVPAAGGTFVSHSYNT